MRFADNAICRPTAGLVRILLSNGLNQDHVEEMT